MSRATLRTTDRPRRVGLDSQRQVLSVFPGRRAGSSARTSTGFLVRIRVHSLVIASATELLLTESRKRPLDHPHVLCPEVSALVCYPEPAVLLAQVVWMSVLGLGPVQGFAPSAKRLPTRRRLLPPCRYLPWHSPTFAGCRPKGLRLRGLVPCGDAIPSERFYPPGDSLPSSGLSPSGTGPASRAATSRRSPKHPLMAFRLFVSIPDPEGLAPWQEACRLQRVAGKGVGVAVSRFAAPREVSSLPTHPFQSKSPSSLPK